MLSTFSLPRPLCKQSQSRCKLTDIPTTALSNFFIWSKAKKLKLPVEETKMSMSDMTIFFAATWTPSSTRGGRRMGHARQVTRVLTRVFFSFRGIVYSRHKCCICCLSSVSRVWEYCRFFRQTSNLHQNRVWIISGLLTFVRIFDCILT